MKSTEIIKPAALVAPLAFNGTKNSIPDSATGTNAASIEEGFPAVTSLPKSEGGLPPARADFNGMFYLSTDQKVYLQNGGILTFSKDVSDAIGGYPKGAILDCFDAKNNTFSKVQSLIDDNAYNFVETPSFINGEYWQLLNFGGANVALSNLSDVGLDKLNQSKALETGNISIDPNVYSEILESAHSSFDKSKFSITGSPTISDDGWVSGINSENYIFANIPVIKNVSKIEFKERFVYKSTSKNCNAFNFLNSESVSMLRVYFNDTTDAVVFSSSVKNRINKAQYNPSDGDVVEIVASLDKNLVENNIVLTVNNLTKGISATSIGTSDSSVDINKTVKLAIGHAGNGSENFTTPIDLKSIAVWANGVLVFNGNKTGLDFIKPDNYEIGGSPTISDDGMFHNNSSDKNLITIPLTYGDFLNKSWEVRTCAYVVPNENKNYIVLDNSWNTWGSLVWNSGLKLCAKFGDASDSSGEIYVAALPTSTPEGWYNLSMAFNYVTGEYTCKAINISTGTVYSNTYTPTTTNKQLYTFNTKPSSTKINLIRATRELVTDLNGVQVYFDGNLVYQPSLKIPYTLSKTGSKIVDVSARNRVQSLYEETGEALYYTLDEQNKNFTLPMGEIYGMISSSKNILDIVYPIGRPMPEENNQLLDCEVWLEGAVVNIVDYPKLFEVYGTAYGGDGVTTFGLPDLRERTLWGSSDSSKGYLEAALPNITGYFEGVASYEDHNGGSGALFYTKSGYSTTLGHANLQYQHTWANVNIDASRSNPIYGRGNTVRTPSFKVRYKTRFK